MRFHREIRFNAQAGTDLIQVGLYNGEEHLIVPCVALVGDGVYYGLHADFPELAPASELAFSLPSWPGRPIIPNHPEEGSANQPGYLDEYQYGQIFYPEFYDNRLRFSLWFSPSRAANAGTTWVIEELEAGNMVEISIGASIELEKVSGTTANGEYYGGIWRNISGDHIAVGLGGGRGACNLDMGCGALRFMSESEMLEAQTMANENSRYVRRIAGSAGGNAIAAPIANPPAAAPVPATKPATAPTSATPVNEPPVSFLASLATRMGGLWNTARGLVDDVGQSDAEIRHALTDAVYHIEPGFGWIEEVFQESMTFIYCCFPWSQEEKWYRRTFTRSADGVTVSDTREEVVNSGGWETVAENPPTQTIATTVAASALSSPACGCHNTANTTQLSQGEYDMKRDEILKRLAALSDDQLEKLVTLPVSTAPATGTTTTTTTETPVPSNPPSNPPAAPPTPPVTTPATSATATATDPANLAATAILGASGIDVAALNAMLAGEKARQDQTREALITALSSRVPDLTREILAPQSTPQLEMMARAAGILGVNVGAAVTLGLPVDYSGIGMPIQPATMSSAKKYVAPDPFGLHKKESATN